MEKELPLKERLLKYLAARPKEWVSSGTLQRLVIQYSKHTPRSAVRRLQELHESGELERELRRNHTWYRMKQLATQQTPNDRQTLLARNKTMVELFDAGKSSQEIFAV